MWCSHFFTYTKRHLGTEYFKDRADLWIYKYDQNKTLSTFHFAEPILESLPQVHILLCLWGKNPDLFIVGQGSEALLFWAAVASSVISAAKGIADFLLFGPCNLVPRDGFAEGRVKMGFIFLLLNIISTMCGKGVILGSSIAAHEVNRTENFYYNLSL